VTSTHNFNANGSGRGGGATQPLSKGWGHGETPQETQQSGQGPRSGPQVKDNWGQPDGLIPRGSCLAILAHLL